MYHTTNGTEVNHHPFVGTDSPEPISDNPAPEKPTRAIDKRELKDTARGQWREIIPAVTGFDADIFDGQHRPCPRCGGTDRFRAFGDFAETGGVICNQCHREDNSDGISAVEWLLDCSFSDALNRIGEYLGIEGGRSPGRGQRDIVADYAQKKEIPLDAFRAFGARVATRGKMPVARVPMYGEDGTECSHKDFAFRDDRWLKGMAANGKPAGLFLRDAKLPEAGETVHLTEGVKDAAALDKAGFPAVGLPTCQMQEKFAPLFQGVHLVLVPDRDKAGKEGAQKTASRLAGKAASVRIASLPGKLKSKGGDDVREVLKKKDGSKLLQQAIDEAVEWEPVEDDRLEIEITPDEHEVNDRAVRALQNDPCVYQRGGNLVRIVEGDREGDGIERATDAPRIARLPTALLREVLSERCRFVKVTKYGEELQHTHPPLWCIDAVAARGSWPGIRHLTGISTVPILRPDGTMLAEEGYDPVTGFACRPSCTVPPIPDRPSADDIGKATETLMGVVRDFPFKAPHHCSAWLAGLLTALGRQTFEGPAPLFLVDGNGAGVGKGLLADVTGIIASGGSMSKMSNPRHDDEARKRITSIAISGDPLVCIDNIQSGGMFGSPAIDAALTAERWQDRLLQQSAMVDLPLRTVWWATGNNVAVGNETSRRVCHIRLETREEHPEERTGFAHPDLKQYVRQNRGGLVAASLTILRGYLVAGRPSKGLKQWGSFEGWSDVIRSAVVWAGWPDPGEAREELRSEADRETEAAASLMEAWHSADPEGQGLNTGEVLRRSDREGNEALRDALVEFCSRHRGKLPTSGALGSRLRKWKGRNIGGRAFDRREGRSRQKFWYVANLSGGDGGDGGDGV